MDAIILSAGYATRLYPLTLDGAKPLLPVGGEPIINYLVYDLDEVNEINNIYVVTNDKFYKQFLDWKEAMNTSKNIVVLNDGTTDDSNKKGAIGDIDFVIEQCNIDDDLLVVAGDNIINFPLKDFVSYFKQNGLSVGVHEFFGEEDLSRYGIVEVDDDNIILDFQEKPENPKTNLVAACLYLFSRNKLNMIKDYIGSGLNKDQPGNYLQWLVNKERIHAYVFDAEWHDIGTKESYNKIKDSFRKEISR